MNRYLRLYPVQWPIFSIKFYTQDRDGWWNPKPKKAKIKKDILHIQ